MNLAGPAFQLQCATSVFSALEVSVYFSSFSFSEARQQPSKQESMLVFILFFMFLHIYVFFFLIILCHDAVRKNIFVLTLGYLNNHTCMISHVKHNYVCTCSCEKKLKFQATKMEMRMLDAMKTHRKTTKNQEKCQVNMRNYE